MDCPQGVTISLFSVYKVVLITVDCKFPGGLKSTEPLDESSQPWFSTGQSFSWWVLHRVQYQPCECCAEQHLILSWKINRANLLFDERRRLSLFTPSHSKIFSNFFCSATEQVCIFCITRHSFTPSPYKNFASDILLKLFQIGPLKQEFSRLLNIIYLWAPQNLLLLFFVFLFFISFILICWLFLFLLCHLSLWNHISLGM